MDPFQNNLTEFVGHWDPLRDSLLNNPDTRGRKTCYQTLSKEHIAEQDAAFADATSNRKDWTNNIRGAGAERQQQPNPNVQSATRNGQLQAQPASRKPDDLVDIGSWTDEASRASTAANLAPNDPFVEPTQQEQSQNGSSSKDNLYEENSDQDEELELSDDDSEADIQGLSSAMPENTTLHRPIPSITTYRHDSPQRSSFHHASLLTLSNQEEYEADGQRASSAEERTSNEARVGTSTPATNPATLPQYNGDRDESNDGNDGEREPLTEALWENMSEKHWLCPYGVKYPRRVTKACRLPTSFKNFSALKDHLRVRHCKSPPINERSELYMSKQDWKDIEEDLDITDKKKPRMNTKNAFLGHQKRIRAVWRILFPNSGLGPKSPYCEDLTPEERETLLDSFANPLSREATLPSQNLHPEKVEAPPTPDVNSPPQEVIRLEEKQIESLARFVFRSRAEAAVQHGEVPRQTDWRASEKDFIEMASELCAKVASGQMAIEDANTRGREPSSSSNLAEVLSIYGHKSPQRPGSTISGTTLNQPSTVSDEPSGNLGRKRAHEEDLASKPTLLNFDGEAWDRAVEASMRTL